MSFGLLLPAALAALAALLIPLVLHLARRSEQRLTEFAALRWLAAKQRPRRRVVLEERALLALRLLLLTLLALFLARPVLFEAGRGSAWIVVAPDVDPSAARAALDKDDAEWRWLAPDFPSIVQPAPAGMPPIASLLRELDARLPSATSVTVVVPEEVGGLDGARPMLGRRLDWRIVAGRTPPSAATRVMPPPKLAVRYAQGREPDLAYLRAAAQAWSAETAGGAIVTTQGAALDVAATQTRPRDGDTDALVWLIPGALPPAIREWVADGGTVLVEPATPVPGIESTGAAVWRDSEGRTLARATAAGRGRVIQLQQALTSAALPALLDAELPEHLRALFEVPPPAPARALAVAHAPLSRAPQRSGGIDWPSRAQSLQPWLALLIALLFLAERWLASSAHRGRAP